jgi:hypothetical protein
MLTPTAGCTRRQIFERIGCSCCRQTALRPTAVTVAVDNRRSDNIIIVLHNISEWSENKMKNNRGELKINIYRSNPARITDQKITGLQQKDGPACSGAAVVHCNQWGCFTRVLCRDNSSD